MAQTNLLYWGNNQHSLLAPQNQKAFNRPQSSLLPHNITDLSASEKHVTFITSDGSLYTYGLNLDGRLGIGAKPDVRCSVASPFRVKLPAAAVKVKCGFSHTCVQLNNDDFYGWGLGDYGALGTGEFKSRGSPGKVLVKGKIINFSCGAMHSGFIDIEGNIFTCGSNEYGELGVNRPEKIATPILVNFGQKVRQIECGVFYTLLLTRKGQVYGMGNNKYGQLGIGHKVNQCHPTLIRQLDNITVIAAGYHSGALDAEGSLYIWGSGSFGELLRPKKIMLSTPLDKIFIRGFFGVGISSRKQRVYAWGNNTYGQLGQGNFQSSKEPVEVSELSNLSLDNFACGVNFFLASTKDSLQRDQYSSARYNSIAQDRRTVNNYRSTTPPPHQGSSYFQYSDERQRSTERRGLGTPSRYHLRAEEALLRSRSRSRGEQHEVRTLIENEIRRSRNRQTSNYEELFISLSADYQTLLARFKAMEEHLELKNRSLIAQKDEITLLFKQENQILRNQNEMLKRQLTISKEELRTALDKYTQSASLSYTTPTEVKTLKDEFKLTIKQLQSLQEQLAEKDGQIKSLRAQIFEKEAATRRIQQEDWEQSKAELVRLNKENKNLRDELRNANRKYEALEEQTTINNVNLKQAKLIKQNTEGSYKEEISLLNDEIIYLNKELKTTKEELKISLRKMDALQEELAIKSLELKEAKQKRVLYDATAQLKQQILTQSQEILLLSRENKALKQQLRMNRHKIGQLEEDVLKSSERDFKQKLHAKDIELSSARAQIATLNRDVKQLREELKKSLRDLDRIDEEKSFKNVQQRRLNDSLKETTKILNEKEKNLAELQTVHKKIEDELYRQIGRLEEEKQMYIEAAQKSKQFEDALKASEEAMAALERHYQLELNQTCNNILKLKQVQDLNELRVAQLKQIIEEEREKYQKSISQAEGMRNKINEATEQKVELFKMIEDLKQKHTEDMKIYKDKIIDTENASGSYQERIDQLEAQLSYEKQYQGKCQETIKDLTDQKDKACRELEIRKQENDKFKEKIKDLSFEVDKAKTLKKQVEVLSLQIERMEANTQQYRKEIEDVLVQKEDILNELRSDLEKKQSELEKVEEKYEEDTASLGRQVKSLDQKLSLKNKQCNEYKRECERRVADIEAMKDTIDKLDRKIIFNNEQFQKQVKEHQKTTQQFNHLRRQYTKLKAEKQNVENQNDQLVHEKEGLELKIVDKKKQIQLAQSQKKQLDAVIQNMKRENEHMKKELEQSNWALEQSRGVNEELSKANKQFAENQEQFTSKISELESRVFELQDQNKSYTPRYEALIQRNKELDERNRELSEMINKAIEIQAQAYKSNILKEVEINTGQIIQQIRQEQEYKPRSRRREVQLQRQIDPSETENISEPKSPGIISKIKDEPYTRLMQEKISMHKKRVSDSAQKLAGILEMGHSDGEPKSFERSMGRRDEDYERINSQMQSLNQQKQDFMQKINNFAEKLKIL